MAYRILVADDSLDSRKVLQALLVAAGFHVDLAADGSEALQRLLDGPETYDLSLLDVHMPSLTGLEVVVQLRAMGHVVPSILMTGHPSRAIEAAALEAGARAMLRKPIAAEILRVTVRQIIRDIRPTDRA